MMKSPTSGPALRKRVEIERPLRVKTVVIKPSRLPLGLRKQIYKVTQSPTSPRSVSKKSTANVSSGHDRRVSSRVDSQKPTPQSRLHRPLMITKLATVKTRLHAQSHARPRSSVPRMGMKDSIVENKRPVDNSRVVNSFDKLPKHVLLSTQKTNQPTPDSTVGTKPKPKPESPHQRKEYLTAGFYCQNADVSGRHTLVHKLLSNPDRKGKRPARDVFPPLPIEHGETLFFNTENEFNLPYDIRWCHENGKLDGKKRPPPYRYIRSNIFPERSKLLSDVKAVCNCEPSSKCGQGCINRVMSYLCGKDCPSGEACGNKSLCRRKQPTLKVAYTGTRGFGLFAQEDIEAGQFVIDYRGEVVSLQTFIERIGDEYKAKRNFYALAYDQDEVIDAGMKGNDARFINHGCDPNLEVRKYMTIGDGYREFEVGAWASRKILKGEELFYNYNFDNFGVHDTRTKCFCGAESCLGYLGREKNEGEVLGNGRKRSVKPTQTRVKRRLPKGWVYEIV